MPARLVHDAIAQSRNREPLLTAMAMLTGSRVLAYMDLPSAKRAFAEAAEVADSLRLDSRLRQLLNTEVVTLGVASDPETALSRFRCLELLPHLQPFLANTLMNSLAALGETEMALALFEDMLIPAGDAHLLIRGRAPEFQQRVLRAARTRWRNTRRSFPPDNFYRLFSQHFRALPPAEATAWLDEIWTQLESEPLAADRISARYGESVHLETFQDMNVFEILNVLRALRPPAFVDEVLSRFPAVAKAAAVYPLGLDSLWAQPSPHPGKPAGFPTTEPLLWAHNTAVARLLDEAHHSFQEDVRSNTAPRAFWPSGHAYKLALHWAGQRHGIAGSEYLPSIPDTDLAILAAIELAAGVLGLPMRNGVCGGTPAATPP